MWHRAADMHRGAIIARFSSDSTTAPRLSLRRWMFRVRNHGNSQVSSLASRLQGIKTDHNCKSAMPGNKVKTKMRNSFQPELMLYESGYFYLLPCEVMKIVQNARSLNALFFSSQTDFSPVQMSGDCLSLIPNVRRR